MNRAYKARLAHSLERFCFPLMCASVALGPAAPAIGDDSLTFKSAGESLFGELQYTAASLVWDETATDHEFSASLADHRNFIPEDATSPADSKHGTHLGSEFAFGDSEEVLWIDGQISASRYDGFDVLGTTRGVAGDFGFEVAAVDAAWGDVSGFARIAGTQSAYVPLKDVIEDDDLSDPFARPGWMRAMVGAATSTGPLTFSLAGVNERTVGSNIDGQVWWGPDLELTYENPEANDENTFEPWLPTSAYAGLEYRVIDFDAGLGLREGESRDVNIGASWNFGVAQLDLGFENNQYSARGPGADTIVEKQNAIDVGIGYFDESWSSYFYVSAGNYSYTEGVAMDEEAEIDASLSFEYYFDYFPSVEVTFGYYVFDGSYSGAPYELTERSVALGLDLMDFLEEPEDFDASFEVSLGYVGRTEFDSVSMMGRRGTHGINLGFNIEISG